MELVKEFLAERGRDLEDGLTLRVVHRRVEEHISEDLKKHERFERLMERFETSTGSFHIPPQSTQINIGRSKRPSLVDGLKEAMVKPLGLILLALATVVAQVIVRLWMK